MSVWDMSQPAIFIRMKWEETNQKMRFFFIAKATPVCILHYITSPCTTGYFLKVEVFGMISLLCENLFITPKSGHKMKLQASPAQLQIFNLYRFVWLGYIVN